MCRRWHRKARWPGLASHRGEKKKPGIGWAAPQSAPGHYAGAMREGGSPPRFPMPPSASSKARARDPGRWWSCKINHFLTSDDKYRDLIYDGDKIARILPAQAIRRAATGSAGRMENHVRPPRGLPLCGASTATCKNMVEAIANAKLRRMERELELRGIRFDRPNKNLGNAPIPAGGALRDDRRPIRPEIKSTLRTEHRMRQLSSPASIAVSLSAPCRGVPADVSGAVLGRPTPGKYRPEDHYMRGPGPKWREKHLLDRAGAN